MSEAQLPSLTLKDWKNTRDTLHKYSNMVGAIREKMSTRIRIGGMLVFVFLIEG